MINFRLKNLVSPFEKLESPDARKLGLLLKASQLKKENEKSIYNCSLL